MYFVVCYDIESDKSRRQISKALFDYGLTRVQKSVFEGDLLPKRLAQLKKRLAKWIDPEADDSICYYPLCETCRSKISRQGFDNGPRFAQSVEIV